MYSHHILVIVDPDAITLEESNFHWRDYMHRFTNFQPGCSFLAFGGLLASSMRGCWHAFQAFISLTYLTRRRRRTQQQTYLSLGLFPSTSPWRETTQAKHRKKGKKAPKKKPVITKNETVKSGLSLSASGTNQCHLGLLLREPLPLAKEGCGS